MDSFTIAVVIGGGLVLVILVGLILVDKGAPEAPPPRSKPTKE